MEIAPYSPSLKDRRGETAPGAPGLFLVTNLPPGNLRGVNQLKWNQQLDFRGLGTATMCTADAESCSRPLTAIVNIERKRPEFGSNSSNSLTTHSNTPSISRCHQMTLEVSRYDCKPTGHHTERTRLCDSIAREADVEGSGARTTVIRSATQRHKQRHTRCHPHQDSPATRLKEP